jgi:hypothetical protein
LAGKGASAVIAVAVHVYVEAPLSGNVILRGAGDQVTREMSMNLLKKSKRLVELVEEATLLESHETIRKNGKK